MLKENEVLILVDLSNENQSNFYILFKNYLGELVKENERDKIKEIEKTFDEFFLLSKEEKKQLIKEKLRSMEEKIIITKDGYIVYPDGWIGCNIKQEMVKEEWKATKERWKKNKRII